MTDFQATAWVAVLLLGVLILTLTAYIGRPEQDVEPAQPCPGPLVWFETFDGQEAVFECCCGYLATTGNFHDEAHAATPLMKEGMAA
ncbi:MAG: hypothetical protein V4515_12655 [Chloroflexota bacterium]